MCFYVVYVHLDSITTVMEISRSQGRYLGKLLL